MIDSPAKDIPSKLEAVRNTNEPPKQFVSKYTKMLYDQQSQQITELTSKKFASQTTTAFASQETKQAALNTSETPTPLQGMLPQPSK